MDELVKLGLAKWPNVPDCFGWLALDARGRWRIGESRQRITHAPTIGFINRNYISDAEGRWLFQNGPQRVYVDLEYTPFVFSLQPATVGTRPVDHTGTAAPRPDAVWIDDGGRFLLACGDRVGVLHDHDSALLLGYACDPEGRPLGESEIERVIESAMLGRDARADAVRLALRWPDAGSLLEVVPICRDAVPEQFHFTPHPIGGGEERART